MCHSKHRQAGAEPAAYEGRTIALGSTRGRHRRFPYWVFWLIWPLMAGLKSLLPLYADAGRTLTQYVGENGPAVLAGVALIIAGLVLINRNR